MPDWREEEERWLQEVVRTLKTPPPRSPHAVDRVVRAAMARRAPTPQGDRRGLRWGWLTEPRLSPLAAGGWVLATAAVALFLFSVTDPGPPGDSAPGTVVQRFVLSAPQAHSVSVVGDFNNWQVGATPLTRDGDWWSVEVPLESGRHLYSFVIDGETWVPDSNAPRAAEEEFGRPSSVLLVNERGA